MAQSNVNILTEKAIRTAWNDIEIKIAETIVQSRSKINLSCENILLKC